MMRVLIIATLLYGFLASDAQAQDAADPAHIERLELARKLNDANPVTAMIGPAIDRVAESWGVKDTKTFRAAVLKSMDMKKIEQSSVEAFADVFTKEELAHMISFYSAPEAKKINEKMPIYQDLIQPVITRDMDRALMDLRTGSAAAPASVQAR